MFFTQFIIIRPFKSLNYGSAADVLRKSKEMGRRTTLLKEFVLYRGDDIPANEDGIEYVNVERYLAT